MKDGLENHKFAERGAVARSHRQINFQTYRIKVAPGENRAERVALTCSDIQFQFDALYPHPGGENTFQFKINDGNWMQFLLGQPPLEIGTMQIYAITFWNKTAADIWIRFITAMNPAAFE
jgi:hypothetical protein